MTVNLRGRRRVKRFSLPLLSIGMLLATTLACLGGGTEILEEEPAAPAPVEEAPPADTGPASVEFVVVNNSAEDVCYLYLSPTAANQWGDDQLGSETILLAGSSFTVTDVPPDVYDVRFESCSGEMLEDTGLDMSAGNFEYPLDDSAGWSEPSISTFEFVLLNQSSSDICYMYFSPTGSNNWGSDQLGEGTIVFSGEMFTLTGIVPGVYDARFETCDGTSVERYGLDMSGESFEFTLTD
jgi:hypothetical protein